MSTTAPGSNPKTEVLLWGDSLTEGKPGVAYTDYLVEALPDIQFTNRGRGGDTALSLLRRLKEETVPPHGKRADIAVLWVGVNDVFADLVPGYGFLKTALRQPPTRDPGAFASVYSSILDNLFHYSRHVLTLPPLFVGENPDTELNMRLVGIGDIISRVSEEKNDCHFADMRSIFPRVPELAPGFIPVNPWSRLVDVFGRVEDADYDKASERRGLKWTYDGVHLNSSGARRICSFLSEQISLILTPDYKGTVM